VTWLSDAALGRLRRAVDEPDLEGTRYRLLELLGRGGMGTVYRAWDEVLDREVALKVLPLAEAGGDLALRLRREARVLARLDHPGMVPVHDLGTLPDGRVFYAMQRVRGRRLDELVGDGPPPEGEEGERLRIFERVCEAVAFAHDRGVVHRDLKPENVMVGPFGEVLVMDWGVARLVGEGPAGPAAQDPGPGPAGDAGDRPVTAHGTVLGTPGYMAPEQTRGEVDRHDRRVDVYALGALLGFLLRGGPPGEEGPGAGLAAALAAIVLKATAEAPDDRYAGAAEIAAEVARYRAALPVRAHRERFLERLGRVARKYRVPIALVLAYLVMRLLFLLLAGF
jgi:serine/threonine protein kinase